MQLSIRFGYTIVITFDTQMIKTAALRIRISPDLHQEFLNACKLQDLSASHVLRELMKSYIDEHKGDHQPELFAPTLLRRSIKN